MHLHVLGIGGTFMAGMARLAVELGHEVTGSDQALYPPMSTQLEALGIRVFEGYDPAALDPAPDLVVVGNALSRGNPCVEHILSNDLPYASGPEWLERHVLPGRHVIAIAGTHGKTTTTSLTAWLLEATGLAPGFLIGGVAENFGVSARLGSGKAFVIEADEYDTAFFDKRSKFVHYHPRTLVINNLEFDHADIFDDLGAIQRQFHHLVRTMPAEARILRPAPYPAIDEVLERGVWSAVETFGTDAACDWRFRWAAGDPATFALEGPGGVACGSTTPLMGLHNAWNTAAAIAAAASVGVAPGLAAAALPDFASVRRRLELRGRPHGISVYDDFAHHPTAIAATIGALRATVDRG
ncbi:MAG: UDP-N-acetylmuramate:L-alanyl-gamma-D-glutamyl-meso-diaminopimelate ligase, partial [Gammaproteobacteria bacterium]